MNNTQKTEGSIRKPQAARRPTAKELARELHKDMKSFVFELEGQEDDVYPGYARIYAIGADSQKARMSMRVDLTARILIEPIRFISQDYFGGDRLVSYAMPPILHAVFDPKMQMLLNAEKIHHPEKTAFVRMCIQAFDFEALLSTLQSAELKMAERQLAYHKKQAARLQIEFEQMQKTLFELENKALTASLELLEIQQPTFSAAPASQQ